MNAQRVHVCEFVHLFTHFFYHPYWFIASSQILTASNPGFH